MVPKHQKHREKCWSRILEDLDDFWGKYAQNYVNLEAQFWSRFLREQNQYPRMAPNWSSDEYEVHKFQRSW